MIEVDRVIVALEGLVADYEHRSAGSELASLEEKCVHLSLLESIVPGTYWAALELLDGIKAARIHARPIAKRKMHAALRTLRSLPSCN
ncbi:MAG TPA: hypothetical protein VN737_22815 [Bryobacteraceae bacterium]|nr:hypothetical protein [Bryobacteraceae bacterium]